MAISRSADDLLASARRSLTEASIAATAGERYAAAHLAALRAAAAVLADRGRPATRRSRVLSVWGVRPEGGPALGEWAAFVAAGAGVRAAAGAVPPPPADRPRHSAGSRRRPARLARRGDRQTRR